MSPSFPPLIFKKREPSDPSHASSLLASLAGFLFNRISAIQNNPSAGIASERSKKNGRSATV